MIQSGGKSTLARHLLDDSDHYFDLEDPLDVARLENPLQTLGRLKGLIVIDEVQFKPALFPLLRVLADQDDNPARFLILGSASPHLVKGVSESFLSNSDEASFRCRNSFIRTFLTRDIPQLGTTIPAPRLTC